MSDARQIFVRNRRLQKLGRKQKLMLDVSTTNPTLPNAWSNVITVLEVNFTTDERHKALFDWLDPIDVDVNHRKARYLHEPSTGDWIKRSQQFQSWMTTTGAALWLSAKGMKESPTTAIS
jgi:hypothetical protein